MEKSLKLEQPKKNKHFAYVTVRGPFINITSSKLLFYTRNSPNGYVAIAGEVQERKLNAQTEHCSAKCEK